MRFPTLTFEEFRHAALYMSLRSFLLAEQGLPTIDHLLVKWYVKDVLHTPAAGPGAGPMRGGSAGQHIKYFGALQTMIKQELFLVTHTSARQVPGDPNSVLRVLKLHPQNWPQPFLQLDTKSETQPEPHPGTQT